MSYRIMVKVLLIATVLNLTSINIPIYNSELDSNDSGRITVKVENLKNNNGALLISLFKNPNGYPEDWEAAYQYQIIPASDFSGNISFENIPYGSYAFAIIHDENENLKLDRNLFGIPREGYAFSNNVRGRFGPPEYQLAVFELQTSEIKQNIILIY